MRWFPSSCLGTRSAEAPATLGYKYMKLELQIPHSQSGDWERDKHADKSRHFGMDAENQAMDGNLPL